MIAGLTLAAGLVAPPVSAGLGDAYFISGTVADGSGVGLPGVAVSDGTKTVVTATSPPGRYTIGEPLPGDYVLRAERADLVTSTSPTQRLLAPGTTQLDFSVLYIATITVNRAAVSTAGGAAELVVTVNSFAPNPGTPGGAQATSCVAVTDSRTGVTQPASFVSSNPDGSKRWTFSVSLAEDTVEGAYEMGALARDCGTSAALTPVVSVAYKVDNTAPFVSALVPGDSSNTVFGSQPLSARLSDEGGAGLDPASVRFTLEDTTAGTSASTPGSGVSEGVSSAWAYSPSYALVDGHEYRAFVKATDMAGNTVHAAHNRPSGGGGFSKVSVAAVATRATVPRTGCTFDAAARSPSPAPALTKKVTCRNVPLRFASTTGTITAGMRTIDSGFVYQRASLRDARFVSPTGELFLPNPTDAQFGDRVRAQRYELPWDRGGGPIVLRQLDADIGSIRGEVPGTWTGVSLEMPGLTGNGVDVTSDLTGGACAGPITTDAQKCRPDPTSSRYRLLLASTSASPESVASTLATSLDANPTAVSTHPKDRYLDIEIAPGRLAAAAATSGVVSTIRLPSLSDEIASDRGWREQFAFRHDREFVTGLYRAPGLTNKDQEFGAILDAEELAEAQIRFSGLDGDLDAVDAWVASSGVAGRFGGKYISHALGGKVAVVTSDPASFDGLAATMPHPERLAIVAGAYTETELLVLQDEIADRRAALLDEAIVIRSVGVDVERNRTEVVLVDGTAAQVARLTELFGDRITVTRAETQVPITLDPADLILAAEDNPANRSNDTTAPAYIGGIRIYTRKVVNNGATQYFNGCTLGWSVQVSGDAGSFALSTDHCWKEIRENDMFHAGRDIGNSIASPSAQSGEIRTDSALVRGQNSDTFKDPEVYRYYGARRLVTGDEDDPDEGEIRCISGATTGGHCGRVISPSVTFFHEGETPYPADDIKVVKTVKMNYMYADDCPGSRPCRPIGDGDSGAPVFLAKSGEVHASGTQLGGRGERTEGRFDTGYYTRIKYDLHFPGRTVTLRKAG